jgi:uncharacterized protein (DUF2062 family)
VILNERQRHQYFLQNQLYSKGANIIVITESQILQAVIRILSPMFKRQTPLKPVQKVKEMLWPSMGWRRAAQYIYRRIVRLQDSTHNIASGLAIGAFVSFSPLLGTHFIQAAAVAYVLRVNVLSSLIGTFIGNPWTFPLIWWSGISFGTYLFGLLGVPAADTLPQTIDASVLWDILTHDPKRLFMPWMVGGYLVGLALTVPFYFAYYYMVQSAKNFKSGKQEAV